MERRQKWLSFVLPENKDGLRWQPANGALLTLSPEKKSEDAGDPDFVPSVYPKIVTEKRPSSSEASNAQSVAHYICAKQRSANKEIAEQETRQEIV